jgi:hypothetical protein
MKEGSYMRVGPTTQLLPLAITMIDLVIKVIQLSKDNIRKGVTMQPITITQQYPTCNA